MTEYGYFPGRRSFLAALGAGAAGLSGCSAAGRRGQSAAGGFDYAGNRGGGRVSFVTSTDQRDAAYRALKPIQRDIENAIGNRRVVVKVNFGVVDNPLAATDVNQVRGILDFLGGFYDRNIIISEGTSVVALSSRIGYENYGYNPLTREYGVKLVDHNDLDTQVRFVKDNRGHPFPINIVDLYCHPDQYYYISATRFKNSGGVVVTLSLKNIVMGSPVNHYTWKKALGRNEKTFMHQGGHRGQSWNIFMMAASGIRPDLAVLDGVVGMEGDGPLDGTPVEQGVALASTDFLAADRLATELIGVDYGVVPYLKWCGEVGMGNDNLATMDIVGPDWHPHVVEYKKHSRYDQQIAWVLEDREIPVEKKRGTPE